MSPSPFGAVTVVSIDPVPLGIVAAAGIVTLGGWAFRLGIGPQVLGGIENRHGIGTHGEELFLGGEIVELGKTSCVDSRRVVRRGALEFARRHIVEPRGEDGFLFAFHLLFKQFQTLVHRFSPPRKYLGIRAVAN